MNEPSTELLLELAWGIIANAGGSDWKTQTSEWQDAASRWRNNYFEWLDKYESRLARRAELERET